MQTRLARCGNRRAGDRPRGPAPGLAPLAAVKAVKVAQSGPVQNFPKDSSEFRKTTREYCDQMIRNPRRNPVACVCGPGPALAICFMCVSVCVSLSLSLSVSEAKHACSQHYKYKLPSVFMRCLA